MLKKIIIYLLFVLPCWREVYSQNLVPNWSFEIIDTCLFNVGNCTNGIGSNVASPWEGISVDLYNTCSINPNCDVPTNTYGYQYAHTGNG